MEELGIGLVPYSPLGKGFLTGTIDVSTAFDPSDFRNNLPRFKPNALTANQGVVDLLRSLDIPLKRTDESGSIKIQTDGRDWSLEPSGLD